MYSDLFLKTAERYRMFSPGDKVCVGFSGGADSVCLLSLLYENRSRLDITLTAAHINHCLRGEQSDADEAFVKAFCAERDIELRVLRADVAALAEEQNESIELCARNVRYGFFATLGADKIATAHTGSDAAETLLMNLARGASLHGLCGIPPVRGNIVRPLIGFTRTDTEAYCKEQRLSFCTDGSNLTDAHTRNRIRHHVIPPMKEIFPAFEPSVMRCMESLRTEEDYMRLQTQKALSAALRGGRLHIPSVADLHPALLYRVLAAYISENPAAEYETVHLLLAAENLRTAGYALTLPGGARLRTDGTYLYFCDEKIPPVPERLCSIKKNELSDLLFGGVRLRFTVEDRPADFRWNPSFIDFDKIDDIIEIRYRNAGDRIRLPKRNCSKTLKKAYTEMGIPADERARFPVISDSRGLIWAYLAGTDASRLADENTTKIMIISSESES